MEDITIPLARYNEMQEAVAFLDALHAAGVDNWEGYSEALQMVEEEA